LALRPSLFFVEDFSEFAFRNPEMTSSICSARGRDSWGASNARTIVLLDNPGNSCLSDWNRSPKSPCKRTLIGGTFEAMLCLIQRGMAQRNQNPVPPEDETSELSEALLHLLHPIQIRSKLDTMQNLDFSRSQARIDTPDISRNPGRI